MGCEVTFFNVKDYWMILRVAWVCGYDCVCVRENELSVCLWHVAKSRGTEDLGEGVSMSQGDWRDATEEVSWLFLS